MTESIKNLILRSEDLHLIEIQKPNKRDRNSWKFVVSDGNCSLAGVEDYMHNYDYRTVTLRRDSHYFLAYKFFNNDTYEYYVDPRKANHRVSNMKYINSLIDYSVLSNDVSETKNQPSFKVTKQFMMSKKIQNFLDLCYYFKEYSAIGTGHTRNLRNLVVLDIDLDCTRQDIKQDVDDLLIKFAECESMPDFYVFNKETNHIQLQWLIQDFQYKDINSTLKEKYLKELDNDINKNREIKFYGTDFTEINERGLWYRKYTLALTDIVKRRKFGDKNYTFWKAKNPMSALMGYYNLELKMPYYEDKELKYRTQEEMERVFSSKELRTLYFNNAPTMEELYEKTKELVDPYMNKRSDNSIRKMEDADVKEAREKSQKTYGKSRNNFVLSYTRNVTWETAKEWGLRTPDDVRDLESSDYISFKNEVFNRVKDGFKNEDKKYNGIWPDTTNPAKYSNEEFNTTFGSSFNYSTQNINISTYDDGQRKRSQESRHLKKDLKLMIVDKIRIEGEYSREELMKKVNRILKKSGHKEISLGSLKRYISESKKLSEKDRNELRKEYEEGCKERKKQLDEAIEKKKNQKKINICRKRCEYLNINTIKGDSV